MTSYKAKVDLNELPEDILNRWKNGDPLVESYVSGIRSMCGYRLASADETRAAVDQAMGDRSLSDILFEMREERR